jgi:hypothetical protein
MSDGAGMTGVAELQELLLATDTFQEFLDEVADRAATEVSPGQSCGVTVRSNGWPPTIASSDGYATSSTSCRTGSPVTTPAAHLSRVARIDGPDRGVGEG